MPTTEIGKADWRAFCDTFSKERQGRTATVEVISADLGAQEAVSQRPFIGISYEEKGSEKGDITILFGAETDDNAEHRVHSATRLYARTGDGANEDAIEIEDAENAKTILRF